MEEQVKIFNEKYSLKLSPNIRMLDIQSEVGELSKEILLCCDYGEKPFEKTKELELEVGDILYSVISFAIENDISPKRTLENVLDKYSKRYERKGHTGSNE